VSYTVNQGASQTSFAVPFVFFTASTDLNVFVDNVARTFDASTSNTTQYTVSGGNGSTGSITTSVTGATGGSTVVITRAVPLSRTTDFPSSGAFEISKLNTELDTVTAIQSDFNDSASRAIRLQDSDSAVSMELPLLASRKGTVLGFNASTGAAEAGPTIANVNSLSAITANINTVAGISANVTTVAGISANTTTVAGISGNVSTVAGIASNVTTVAGKASLITSDFASDMALIDSTFVSKINLVTSDFVTDMSVVTADFIADLNALATTAIIADLDLLATSDFISDLNAVEGIKANVTTVAGIASNVTSVAGNSSNINSAVSNASNINAAVSNASNINSAVSNASNINSVVSNATNINTVAGAISNVNSVGGAIANVNTVATNLSGVNSFADRYRVASSAPSSSLDVGDLYFDTTANELKVYKSSGWAAAGSTVNGTSARFHYDISGTPTSVTGSDAAGNTLAYDAGFCDVYVNGVRMSTADITITSGDTVTFASALADGDEVDIVAFGTFSVSNIVSTGALNSGSITSGFGNIDTGSSTITTTGAITGGTLTGTLQTASQTNITAVGTLTSFRSTGIDDNADGLAITIDSSENVMIGKTSTNFQTVGVEAKTNGSLHATADQNNPIVAVRKTNDGKVQAFYKDATEVGQIGSYLGAYLYMGSTGGTDTHINFVNGNVRPATSSGGHLDNSLALGHSSSRWSDVYVGGNIYLGGTGSANALDDYEEGTFSCSTSQSGYAIQAQHGRYTKIGQLVHINFKVNFNAVGSNNSTITIAGLPFTVGSIQSSGVVRESSNTGAIYVVNVSPSGTEFSINSMDNVSNGSTRTFATNENYIGSFIYHA
jgi:hypothetical protein